MSSYGQRSINRSVNWLGIPLPFSDTGVTWTDNLLCPAARWVDGFMVGAWAWGIQPGVFFGRFDIPWCGAVPARAAYLPRSPENAHTTARRIHDARLHDQRLVQAQNILHSHHIGGDERVNQYNDYWGHLWYEPADQ